MGVISCSHVVLFKEVISVLPVRLSDTTCNQQTEAISSTVVSHIQQLACYFHESFGRDGMSMFDWIWNPFVCFLTDGHEEEELAKLSCDWTLRLQLNLIWLSSFRVITCAQYPLLWGKVFCYGTICNHVLLQNGIFCNYCNEI